MVEQIYKVHNNILLKESDRRKRVSSNITIPNLNIPTMIKLNESSQGAIVFKNNRHVSNFVNFDHTDRNLNKTAEMIIKKDEAETMKKIVPNTTTKKVVIIENKTK